jgi:hypothetical protein
MGESGEPSKNQSSIWNVEALNRKLLSLFFYFSLKCSEPALLPIKDAPFFKHFYELKIKECLKCEVLFSLFEILKSIILPEEKMASLIRFKKCEMHSRRWNWPYKERVSATLATSTLAWPNYWKGFRCRTSSALSATCIKDLNVVWIWGGGGERGDYVGSL